MEIGFKLRSGKMCLVTKMHIFFPEMNMVGINRGRGWLGLLELPNGTVEKNKNCP